MATKPLTHDQQAALDAEIEGEYIVDMPGAPAKLSDQILMAVEDDEIALSVNRKLKGRKTAFLFELDEFEDLNALSTRLRDEYEGGDFVVIGRRANGQLALNHGLVIEKPAHGKTPETEPQNGGNFESILLAMNANAERQTNETRALMLQMNEKSAEASRDNMNMLVKMMEINKPAPQQQMGMSEIIAIMANVKEMTAQPKTENPMDLFIKGMEMGKETSSGGDESILQTAIKSFGAPLANLAALNQGAPTPASPPQIAAPVQPEAPNNPAPETQGEQPKESPEMLAQLELLQKWTPTINTLLKAASINAEPEVYANYLLDQIPLEDIEAFLNDDDTYNKFFEFVQQARPFKQWFDECRRLVLHYLKEADEPLEPPANNVPENIQGHDGQQAPDGQQSNDGEQKEAIPGESAPVAGDDTSDTASTDT